MLTIILHRKWKVNENKCRKRNDGRITLMRTLCSTLYCQFFWWWCDRDREQKMQYQIENVVNTWDWMMHLSEYTHGPFAEAIWWCCVREEKICVADGKKSMPFIILVFSLLLYLSVASYFNQKLVDCSRAPLCHNVDFDRLKFGLFCFLFVFLFPIQTEWLNHLASIKCCYIVDFLFLWMWK